jgi:tetratricopeptide (TPR) repeat protein
MIDQIMAHLTIKSGLRLLKNKDYKLVHSESIARIKADLNDPLPYFLLGNIASDHGNHNKAVELFKKAAGLDKTEIWYQLYYARELSTLGRSNEAKAQADIASALDFTNAYIADTLGVIYSRAEYHALAIPLFEQAVSSNSSQPSYYYNLGASAQFIGNFEKAEAAYKKTIELEPKFYRAWSSLISLEKQTQEDNKLEPLIALFEGTQNDPEGQVQLGHAIAKTLEDLGRHEDSLDWLLRGKKAKREQLRYDRKAGRSIFDAAMTTSETKRVSGQDYPKDSPIFIVGLPRTGTTLVDRILSSHPDVVSAGELNIFAELVKDKAKTQSHLVMDAETFLKTNQLNLSDIGQDYIAKTLDRARGAKHMVDKMPLNFFYAGLVHRALPNARIIALRRGAMDSCLSNFRQLFSTQYSYYNYTFDLEDTAAFYCGFDDLMTHWRDTLPKDRFMEVRYEDIVFDQENQTRRLLDFCELDWDEACMRFHENAAPVSTASSVQVRQPLYSGSIGRWKKYGDKLDGLKTALGDLAD